VDLVVDLGAVWLTLVFLVVEEVMLLNIFTHTKETLLQEVHNILFALVVVIDVVAVVVATVEQVVDSVVA
tara:strand:- start:260 stop:469 length:210 start_codon:yes stop_codon:yes gene_type:complete